MLGRDDLRDVEAAENLLARVAGYLRPGAVDGEVVAREVVRVDDVVRVLQQAAVVLFAAAQLLFDALALGYVADVRGEVQDASVLVLDGRALDRDGELAAVAAQVRRLERAVALFERDAQLPRERRARLGRVHVLDGAARKLFDLVAVHARVSGVHRQELARLRVA